MATPDAVGQRAGSEHTAPGDHGGDRQGDSQHETADQAAIARPRAHRPPDRGRAHPATGVTVADYLWQWHRSHKIEPTTLSGYAGHIRKYLVPHLGHLPVDELRVAHVQAMFDAIADRNTAVEIARHSDDPAARAAVKGIRITSPATMHHISTRFQQLVADAGLPPIRLHDLRHCAATFLKASGADLKDIQETLGHSSITITGDTYTSVIHELEAEHGKADAAAAIVPRTPRHPATDRAPAALVREALNARRHTVKSAAVPGSRVSA